MYFFNVENNGFGYTDLASERRRANVEMEGVEFRRELCSVGDWERITITDSNGEKSIGRPSGIYDTLNLTNVQKFDFETIEDAKDEVARELCRILDAKQISPEKILVVGLGNRYVTPDCIGISAAEETEETCSHKKDDLTLFTSLECSEIAVICPSVSSQTGISSSVIVQSVAEKFKPTVIFAIDSIMARSESRLGNCIQFASTGICPGSGLEKHKFPIDEKTMGVPVISIGVPTVIDAENLKERADAKKRRLYVCPQNIERTVRMSGKIIGGGINQAFGLCF